MGDDIDLKAGTRLRSATDSTEVIVVRAPTEAVDIRCGGHPMVPMEGDAPEQRSIEPGFDGGCQVGKRYADEATGIELLCTKGGEGSLSLGTELLHPKGAKPLPSSD